MSLILYIESATEVCSAALADNGKLIAEKHSSEPRLHAQLLTVYIKQLLEEAACDFNQLDAVCVSKGPGSYTGLRIGVAVAKGLCFALDKPLIGVNTLYSMTECLREQFANRWSDKKKEVLFCPMIDARRMEVYTAIYNYNGEEVSSTKALIMDNASFLAYKEHHLVFFGDGSAKLQAVIYDKLDTEFIPDFKFSATGMIAEGQGRFERNQFENTAYFEPYYLKEFIGKVS